MDRSGPGHPMNERMEYRGHCGSGPDGLHRMSKFVALAAGWH